MRSAFLILLTTSWLHPSAFATPEVPRRSFLKGLSILTGGLLAPRQPLAAPAVAPVAQASAPLQAVRAERVHSLLFDLGLLEGDDSTGKFSPAQIDVVRDWISRSPGTRSVITEKLHRLEEVERTSAEYRFQSIQDFGTPEGIRRGKAWSAAYQEQKALENEIKDAIQEWPWSTLSWPEVFSARVAEVENAVARELGGVDVGRVHQLTEHALTWTASAVRPGAHLFAWLAQKGTAEAPLYSRQALDVLVRNLRPSLPALADKIETINADPSQRRDIIRGWLASSSQFFAMGKLNLLKLNFTFDRFRRESKLDAFAMAPYYARGLAHFQRLRAGLENLDSSALKAIALEELDDLEHLMTEELRALPMKLHSEVAATSHSGHPALVLDPTTLWRWTQTLQGLVSTFPTLAPLADECAVRLAEIEPPPLRIEVRVDDALIVDEAKEEVSLSK